MTKIPVRKTLPVKAVLLTYCITVYVPLDSRVRPVMKVKIVNISSLLLEMTLTCESGLPI